MTDAQLRELERRWRESGALEDETRFVAALRRAGAASDERLALAAHLGDEASRRVLELPPQEPGDLVPWTARLTRWGKEALVRAAVAAARSVLPVYARQHPGDDRPALICEMVDGWLLHHDGARLDAVVAEYAPRQGTRVRFSRARYAYTTTSALRAADEARRSPGTSGRPVLAAGLTPDGAARLMTALREDGTEAEVEPCGTLDMVCVVQALPGSDRGLHTMELLRRHTGLSLVDAKRAIYGEESVLNQTLAAVRQASDALWAPEGLTPARVRAAIRTDLIPWARGERDPVLERV